ncbi:MAG: SUMF1/EgtB/PvdO family nonheme iron enzyme [Pseudomonadota bacterium]
MEAEIFINYRREDSEADAHLIACHLENVYGEKAVFLDTPSMGHDDPFTEQLQKAIAKCRVFIVVIGPEWLTLLQTKHKKQPRDRDYLLDELEYAYQVNRTRREGEDKVLIVPLLIAPAAMPTLDKLPDALKARPPGPFATTSLFDDFVVQVPLKLDKTRRKQDLHALDEKLSRYLSPNLQVRNLRLWQNTKEYKAQRARQKRQRFGALAAAAFAGWAITLALPSVSDFFKGSFETGEDIWVPVEGAYLPPGKTPDVSSPAVETLPVPPARRLSEAAEKALRHGDTFRECDHCPVMVVIDPQTVQGQVSGFSLPAGIKRRFAIGRTEVSYSEFEPFAKEEGLDEIRNCRRCEGGSVGGNFFDPPLRNPPPPKGYLVSKTPAMCVSQIDALGYIKWLMQEVKPTNRYRLPADSEWEFSAKGPDSKLPFWDGKKLTRDHANFGSDTKGECRASGGGKKDGYYYPAPVNRPEDKLSKGFNKFGVRDMFGNLFEWTAECYSDRRQRVLVDQNAGNGTRCSWGRLRGGSWASPLKDLSITAGKVRKSNARSAHYGFRVLRELGPSAPTGVIPQ